MIGAARFFGTSLVMVDAGATALMVEPWSFVIDGLRARTRPTSYTCSIPMVSIYSTDGWSDYEDTPSFVALYTGRLSSGEYAVALLVMTRLPPCPCRRKVDRLSLTKLRTAR